MALNAEEGLVEVQKAVAILVRADFTPLAINDRVERGLVLMVAHPAAELCVLDEVARAPRIVQRE